MHPVKHACTILSQPHPSAQSSPPPPSQALAARAYRGEVILHPFTLGGGYLASLDVAAQGLAGWARKGFGHNLVVAVSERDCR